jgi:hypothetical protein
MERGGFLPFVVVGTEVGARLRWHWRVKEGGYLHVQKLRLRARCESAVAFSVAHIVGYLPRPGTYCTRHECG